MKIWIFVWLEIKIMLRFFERNDVLIFSLRFVLASTMKIFFFLIIRQLRWNTIKLIKNRSAEMSFFCVLTLDLKKFQHLEINHKVNKVIIQYLFTQMTFAFDKSKFFLCDHRVLSKCDCIIWIKRSNEYKRIDNFNSRWVFKTS